MTRRWTAGSAALVLALVGGFACGAKASPTAPDAGASGSADDSAPPKRTPPRPSTPAAVAAPTIGGCGRACSTAEAAVSYFLTQLQHQDRITALRPLVDWSRLEVDHERLGERWSAMAREPHQHAARDRAIDAWLTDWSGWVDRVADPQQGWTAMRSSGIRLRTAGERDAVVHLQLPPLRAKGAPQQPPLAPRWKLVWHLHGSEWLLASIDHDG